MPKGSGRRPKPTALKKLQGNPGKRKLNDREPKPAAGIPDMPPGLSKEAQAEWKRIVPQLAMIGVLTRIDGKALAAYCHCFARWMEAEREIRRIGIMLEEPIFDAEGDEVGHKYKRNPAVQVSQDSMKLMKSFLIEFGMTPSARSRIRVEKTVAANAATDPADDYFAQAAIDASNTLRTN